MSEQNFVGYEYADITVKRSIASVYADGYESFGWKLDGSDELPGKTESVTLKFKRDRKLRNKAELTRLQHSFDACASQILSLEASKYLKASIAAFSVGILGTAFMAGSVFAITAHMVLACVILAIPAFIGWVLPYFLYRGIEKKKTAEVSPLIEKNYDDLYSICEKASSLLRSAE